MNDRFYTRSVCRDQSFGIGFNSKGLKGIFIEYHEKMPKGGTENDFSV